MFIKPFYNERFANGYIYFFIRIIVIIIAVAAAASFLVAHGYTNSKNNYIYGIIFILFFM
jgi:hypothetical protein